MNETEKEKMLNLLADETLFGLSETEAAELENLRRKFPELANDDSFEIAAAAFVLSNLETGESLPANLQTRILGAADDFFAASERKQTPVNFTARTEVSENFKPAAIVEPEAKLPWWSWLGWGVAALASIALAVNLWTTRNQPKEIIVQNPPVVQTPTPQPSILQERERLVTSANDLVQTSWTEANPKDNIQASGDIVWSSAEQKGYVRLRGLPVNDAGRETYQLWIVDENQPTTTPVDGGVFNVGETGEIIVPIDAKIAVKNPKMFAVTREKPGGVVVSAPGRIIAVAKV